MTTTLRTLKTINNKKRILLEFVGYKSIKGFRRENTEFINKTDNQTYKYLLDLYNDKVEELREEKIENKKQMNKKPKRFKIKVKKKKVIKLNPFDIYENYKTIINSKKSMLINLKIGSKSQQINIDVDKKKSAGPRL